MEITEKAVSLLPLLLLSSLLMCTNVDSHLVCPYGEGCHLTFYEVYANATVLFQSIYTNTLKAFQEFIYANSGGPFFFIPGIKKCHTADIPDPVWNVALYMQHKDLLTLLLRYLISWNEPLQELSRVDQPDPDYLLNLRTELLIINVNSHKLQLMLKLVIRQIDPEYSDNLDYASWSGELLSSDEESRLFHLYNTLRCLLFDVPKIRAFLLILKCRYDPEDIC